MAIMGHISKAVKYTSGAVGIALTLIVPFEGERLKAYFDPPGIPTICFGHTKDVKITDTATHEQCIMYLEEDASQKQKAVKKLLKREVSIYVEGALIDFAYNAGEGNLEGSSIIRKINAGDIRGGCEAMAACVYDSKKKREVGFGCGYAGGKQLKGLKVRRKSERDTCLMGVNDNAE